MSTASFPYDLSADGGLPASRLCGVHVAEKDRTIAQGVMQFEGQDKWVQRQRPFGLTKRARRVRLRGQQPKQLNATTRGLAIMNVAIRSIKATAKRDSAIFNAKPYCRACRRHDNPMSFDDFDTGLRGSAFIQSEAKLQLVSKAKDNFRKDDDVRWQSCGARQTVKGNPEGERGGGINSASRQRAMPTSPGFNTSRDF